MMIDEMLKYNIEPVMTITHYEMPVHLVTEYNGLLSKKTIDAYVKYAKTLFDRYHKKVKYWILFNQVNCLGGWGEFSSLGLLQGYRQSDVYQAIHHLFVAGAQATKYAHDMYPDLQIGMMLGDDTRYPRTCKPEDVFACTQKNQMICKTVFPRSRYPN